MQLSLLVTCMGDVLLPAAAQSLVRLLRRLGHDIHFPAAQTCCGQPFYNSGFCELAREQARHTIGVFAGERTVVVPSGSCAAMVKLEYPRLFQDDPAWHARAVEFASRTFELSDLLVNRLGVLDVGARFKGTVTYHYACHLRGLGISDEGERLISHVQGTTLVPLAHRDQCCGFGGSFSVRYPEISTAMVDDKLASIAATGADAVVSTDLGCLMNIGGRLRREGRATRIMHLAELLESR